MKKYICSILVALTYCIPSFGQTETFNKEGYELTFINQDPALQAGLKQRMVDAFFSVYPKLAKDFNPSTAKKVVFVIDTSYKGVAVTSNGKVIYSSKYMAAKPGDIDVVTHEVMHIVQNYGNSVGPWWLTEGIADYVRYVYGIDNAGAKWSMPELTEKHNYDTGYRVTARFLYWVEKKIKAGTVKELDDQLRLHTFTDNSWKQLTGKDLAELWAQYKSNPFI